jgi:hypothetical protein
MGRLGRSLTGRRVVVGVVAIGALALVGCGESLKDPAPVKDPAPECTTIYFRSQPPGDPQSIVAEPAPFESACLPICGPGDEVVPVGKATDATGEAAGPVLPPCIVVCPEEEPRPPEQALVEGPGDPAPRQECNVPPCALIPPGQPGACDEARR